MRSHTTHETQANQLILHFSGGTILLNTQSVLPPPPPLTSLRWDERVKTYRGPAYRLPDIQKEMLGLGYQPILQPAPYPPPSIMPGEISTKNELRPYQKAALSAWQIAGMRGLLALPTGSGKTRIAAEALRACGRSALVLVPTRVLLQQWIHVLRSTAGLQPGILGDGESLLKPITVATFESAYRHMPKLGHAFELLVIDEVHHFGHGLRDEALEMSIAPFRLGLTATIPQDSKWQERMKDLVGPLVYELSLQHLRGSYLSDFEVVRLHVELNTNERAAYDKEMQAFRLVHEVFRAHHPHASWQDFAVYAGRTEAGREALRSWRAARAVLPYTEGKKLALRRLLKQYEEDRILIFTADTATAYAIAKEHLLMPLTADIPRSERDAALGWFRDGEISALVTCQVLNEGLDVPDANIAIILGGAKGEREHIQRIGRVLRWKEGKRACIYEIVCNRTSEIRQANRRGRNIDS